MPASFKQRALAFAVAAAFAPPLLAQELPTGGDVTKGTASISQSGSSMHIEQSSAKAVLEWQSFSIGQGGHVSFFQQQGPSSVALNRVLGNNPSNIFGTLTANGRVFLVNPSGILFGPTANVNVGALVASTLSITDDDFLAGVYRFSNAGGAGGVVNDGSIVSHSGYTALLGTSVANNGFILASMGSAALAAGDRVSLDMVGDNLIRVSVDPAVLGAAVVNTGNIEAFGGNVLLTARSANAVLDTVLNTQGFVRAARMAEVGGEIVLDGGSHGNIEIRGGLSSEGAMAIRSGGDVNVSASGFVSTAVTSSEAQTISARGLAIRAQDGASAFVGGGEQEITLLGGSLDVQTLAGGGSATLIGSSQRISVVDGDHIEVSALGGGHALVGAFGGTQSISITGTGRNAVMVGHADALGGSFVQGDSLTLTAGQGSEQGSISVQGGPVQGGFANIGTNFGEGPQTNTIATTGTLSVLGGTAASGFASGIFHNRQGAQTIRARSIEIIAGTSGSRNDALVNSQGGGDQWMEVSGAISVVGGQGGENNTAGLGTAGRGNQTIIGNPDIYVAGGATSNASIQAGLGKIQTIEAHNITLTNGVDSPGNSAGVILAPTQRITTTGDVTLTAQSGTGGASGVRIGAPTAGTPTDLVLNVGGNLVLTGGTTGTNGASLGGGPTSNAFTNNIVVTAVGDVILDGAVGGGGVRIGSGAPGALPGGDVFIAGRSIQFIGTAPSAIRTSGNVALNGGEIVQGANGLILADRLSTNSGTSTSLIGANQVSSFNGTAWIGDVTLNNSGPLEVTGMSATNAALTNAGPVTLLGPWFSGGDSVITTTGSGADLTVTGNVFAQGRMRVDVAGNLSVIGADGNRATLNAIGDQAIDVAGGSFEVGTVGGGFAEVSSFAGDQAIAVRDGDHFDVAAAGGGTVFVTAGQGRQTLSITGDGPNAMTFGREGSTGLVIVSAHSQRFTAGTGLESGSITVTGPAADGATTQISTFASGPGASEQAIATTGTLTIAGGSRITGDPFITGFLNSAPGLQSVAAARLELRGGTGVGNSAVITTPTGAQRIDVAELLLVGGAGANNRASIDGASQEIEAGRLLLAGGSGAGNGAFISTPGQQSIDVSGDLELLGGPGSAVALSSGGMQTISASNLRLQGAFGGANSGAFVNGVGQNIDVSGEIVVAGGSGTNNGAGINSGSMQTIAGRPDITVTGGVSNNATINAGFGALQSIEARNIALSNSSGPGNSAGVIQGTHQAIDATGNVTLGSHAAEGELSGARIGGAGGSATDLLLTVGGDLVISGGSAGQNGASLGGSVAPTAPALTTDITVIATGDVILDGASGGAGVRIGSSPRRGIAGGDISLTGRSVVFTGSAPAVIRTLGDVELHADPFGGAIEQGANGSIHANELTTTSGGSTSLAGANQVSSFNGTSWSGDVALNNAGALEVTGMSAINAALTNAGPVTISGWWNTFGDTSIATSGAGSDLLVTNSVFAGGAMNVDVSGSLSVIATGGAAASLESAGHQSVAVSGGSIEVLAQGGSAGIVGGSQAISIVDGDHLSIVGDLDGFAGVLSINGAQAVSLAGSGDNAIIIGRQGGSGFSTLNAATQDITAGLGGQSGSITILGPDAGMAPFATIAARGDGGQTVSTSGPISVIGGTASAEFGTVGFFNDGSGQQTITAGSIQLRGGPGGTGPGVFMNSNGGGDQVITVSGDIEVVGGTGRNASIAVNPLFSTRQAKQTIGAANIRIAAGPGANAAIASNAGGDQLITLSGDLEVAGAPSGIAIVNSVGGDGLQTQTISARSIDLSNAGGSGNSVGVIQGSHQRITASGNVTLTAGSAEGELAAARIGSPTDGATDLELVVGGDLVLTGGTTGLNGAALGGSVLGAALDNDITVSVGGDLVLDGGAGGAGVRIGTSPRIGLGGGDISITAGNIRFLGSEPAAIRTLGSVNLRAGEISQGANGIILANALTTQSQGSTLLAGQNNVSQFGGTATGDLFLRNLSPLLALGPVSASGLLGFDQSGSLVIQAGESPLVVRGGAVSLVTGGDLRLVGGTAYQARAELVSGSDIDARIGGVVTLDKGLAEESWARIRSESADGLMRFTFPNLTSGGFYVDGVEGDIKHGQTGFFILNKPVKLDETLILDYQ